MMNHIRMEFLSIPRNEALARSVIGAFIACTDPTVEELADVRTAVSEAVTNAIVHGYRNSIGIVSMECWLRGNALTVLISDSGCGIEDVEQAMQPFFTTGDEGERSGMGFAVMKAFMDRLSVESKPGEGTRVRMKKLLSAPCSAAEKDAVNGCR